MNHTPVSRRRLLIGIRQTSDEANDTAFLHKLVDTLKDFPGQDGVRLRVTSEEKIIHLELPGLTNYCPELRQRLLEMVGEDSLTLEIITGNNGQ